MRHFLVSFLLLAAASALCTGKGGKGHKGHKPKIGSCPGKGFQLQVATEGDWKGYYVHSTTDRGSELGLFKGNTSSNTQEFNYNEEDDEFESRIVDGFSIIGQELTMGKTYVYSGQAGWSTPALQCTVPNKPAYNGAPWTGAVNCYYPADGLAAIFLVCHDNPAKKNVLMLGKRPDGYCQKIDLIARDPCHDGCELSSLNAHVLQMQAAELK